ncbi:MAG TPA: response regulator transcription factor [Nitrospiraceae bacterium]|jgi:DNA-binding response OmpR family regulator|nr:response regulator transcription factor [Nitrospiraceae bacterium]
MDETGKNDQPSILLIEDSDDCARMLKFLFTRQGYTIFHAIDGIEAQTMIDTINRPSVVILDMMLPYANGLQLLAHIRSKPSWSSVPVMLLTSDGTTRTIVKAFELGANDYVVKPYKPMELVVRLKRLSASPPSTGI